MSLILKSPNIELPRLVLNTSLASVFFVCFVPSGVTPLRVAGRLFNLEQFLCVYTLSVISPHYHTQV